MKNKAMQVLMLPLLLLPAGFLASRSLPAAATPDPNTAIAPAYGGAYVLFAGKFGGDISRHEIETHTELTVDGCARGARVFQFTLSVTKNGKTTSLKSKSSSLTGDMIAQLKSLSKGDSFEFLDAKAYLPNSKTAVEVRGRKFMVV